MRTVEVTCPDKQRVYHCWHYCITCNEAFMHTQAQCDYHKNHKYNTIPIECDWVKYEVKEWKDLIGNKTAKRVYELTRKLHYNEIKSPDEINKTKKEINDLCDQLNNEGFDEVAIEHYIDWVDLNNNIGNNISNV